MTHTSTTPAQLVLVDPADLMLGRDLGLKNVRASLEKAGYKPATKRQAGKYIEAGWDQELPVVVLGSSWYGSEFYCLTPPWTFGEADKLVPTTLAAADKAVPYRFLAWKK